MEEVTVLFCSGLTSPPPSGFVLLSEAWPPAVPRMISEDLIMSVHSLTPYSGFHCTENKSALFLPAYGAPHTLYFFSSFHPPFCSPECSPFYFLCGTVDFYTSILSQIRCHFSFNLFLTSKIKLWYPVSFHPAYFLPGISFLTEDSTLHWHRV